ncbi:MAG: carbohydrate-binding domain-containing protein [Ruminococcus sp.]|nr:carbohydrate-binding domain-containing protein [Ruminococcus sp.]
MKKSGVKKIVAGLSSLCMLAAAMPAASYAAETTGAVRKLYGDANCDGSVNIADAVLVMQVATNPDKYAQGKSEVSISAAGETNADVDGKKGLTNSDALLIQQHKLGLIDKFPVEDVQPQNDAVSIHLGSSITVEGDEAGYVKVSGSVATITHSGTYNIDGTLEDGQICVNIPDEAADPDTVKLFLNGASITGKSAPAILVSNAENTSINLVDGTENTVSDGDTAYAAADGTLTGEAVIEAKDDLTIKGGDLGTGKLTVTANTQDGVFCKNDLKINGGVIDVKALNSTDKTNGLNGKKSLTVKSGTLTVDAEGDGIKSSKGAVTISGGSTSIKAGNDAVQADTTIDISGGTIAAGGDRGFTATTGINISGGTVIATATDNQAKNVTASGQAVMLLNCIDDATNTKDGTWKKANTLIVSSMSGKVDFTKKYKYVLMSDPSMLTGKQVFIQNLGNGADVAYGTGEAKSVRFDLTNSVNTFDNVDPAAEFPVPETEDHDTEENTINFNGVSVETSASADTATVNGSAVTITKPGTFTVSGESDQAQIIVDVDKTAYPAAVVELDLTGATLSNSNTAPIYVASVGDEVQIVAKKGTVNVISDGTSHTQTYTDSDGNTNNVEGAVFSRDDIKFKGSGTLTINGNQDDAVVCKNDIKIYNGNLTVNAVDDGIRGKDSVVIGDDVKSDGTPADNSGLVLNVNTEYGDGIKSTSDETADGKTYGNVTINGGTVNIVCEALNADTANSAGADGIQAEQSFVMNGGDVNIKVYKGSEYTGSGTSSSSGGQQGGFNGGGFPGGGGGFPGGGGGFGMDGNANKTTNTAKGIKAVGLYESDGTTYKSGGTVTINGGNLTVDSSDDCVHCAGEMQINGGNLVLKSADDGLHSDTTLSIGKTAANTFDDVIIYIPKCYEGVEAVTINQNSGTVYIVSGDDGYNAAGGNDGSGSEPGQGGRPGWGSSSFTGAMNLNGGLVVVNSANGDHDAFDSNGNINVNGGYYCANGQEPLDCGDGGGYSINKKGGNYITMTAGNTNLSTRYSFVDKSGNVIVSFLSASGSVSKNITDSSVSLYTGGTLSDGTDLIEEAPLTAYTGGKLTNGTVK